MEQHEVKGLVVKEVPLGDNDKLLTVITEELGKIYITGKGVKSLKSKHMPATQPFCYSTFIIKRTNKYFYISDSELIESFFGLRSDIDRLALAAYICDIASDLSLEGIGDGELMRLTLNTLYAVSNKKDIPLQQIKAAYEMRAAAIGGFQPDLVACSVCNKYAADPMFLHIMNGKLICGECKYTEEKNDAEDDGTAIIYSVLSPSVLEALRYVIYSPIKKYLSFTLNEDEMQLFSKCAEKYLINHLEHGFYSLDFYKSIV